MIQSRARLILLVVSNCTRRTRRLEKHPPDAPKRDTKLKARKTNDVTLSYIASRASRREGRLVVDSAFRASRKRASFTPSESHPSLARGRSSDARRRETHGSSRAHAERRRHRVQNALNLLRGIHVPVALRELGVDQRPAHRHLERARGRGRGFHTHGGARKLRHDRPFDGGGEAEVASAASVDYGHEGAHDWMSQRREVT